MQPMTPEQAVLLRSYSLSMIEREHQSTRSVIAAIPTANSDYRPDPNSKTALELAWHVVAAEHRFYGGIAAGAFDFTPNHRPENVKTGADIAQWFAGSFASNLGKISQLSADQLLKIIDFRGLFQLPAVAYLTFALNHTIHHRGQLSTYLRAMGGTVPAIYGESYDSALAKAAH